MRDASEEALTSTASRTVWPPLVSDEQQDDREQLAALLAKLESPPAVSACGFDGCGCSCSCSGAGGSGCGGGSGGCDVGGGSRWLRSHRYLL